VRLASLFNADQSTGSCLAAGDGAPLRCLALGPTARAPHLASLVEVTAGEFIRKERLEGRLNRFQRLRARPRPNIP
jgi:hypothetical protein